MPALSPRETETLQHLACGLPVKQVAQVMGIKVSTVRYFIFKAKRKLGQPNIVSMIAVAVQLDLIVFPITFEKMTK